MRTILIPTDFSDNALNASEYAIHFFGTDQIKYVFFHAYLLPNSGVSSLVSIADILEKNAQDYLEEFCQKILKKHPAINYKKEVRLGDLQTTLSLSCEINEPYAVVMGSKGVKGFSGYILGSSAAHAVKVIKTPLFIIPQTFKFKELDHVVYATDYEENAKDKVHFIQDIAALHESALTVLNIKHPQSKTLVKEYSGAINVAKSVTKVEFDFHTMVSDDTFESIKSFVNSTQPDLLILFAKKRSFWQSLWHKSITNKFAEITKTPLLILH